LTHSLSPVIHQAFFDELGLKGSYEKIEVEDEADVPRVLSELAQEGFCGINVTIPYKLTVLPKMASLDESAQLAGAVNTIKFGAGMTGYNTDVGGLAEALAKIDENGGDFLADAADSSPRAILLGAGGAARAAVIALSTLGFRQLGVFCRERSKAQEMLDQLLETAERTSLVHNCRTAAIATFGGEAGKIFSSSVALVVNATPVGQKDNVVPPPMVQLMGDVAGNSKRPIFVDLVYAKEPTPLCRLAKELGFAMVFDGQEMLINQARLAFKIWTGHLPAGELARQRLG
jgi:shikimate dehydrogenase